MKPAFFSCLLLGLLLSAAILPAEEPTVAKGTESVAGYVALVHLTVPVNALAVQFVGSQLSAAESGGARLVILDVKSKKGYSASVEQIAEQVHSATLPVVLGTPADASSPGPVFQYLKRSGIPVEGKARSGAPGTEVPGIAAPVAGLPVRSVEMNGIARVLAEALNPNIAYVLLLLGIVGIAIEFSLPGVGLPGIAGGLSLLISLIALGALSVNVGGLLIILLGLALFVIDIKAPTHGILTAGGIVALLAGSFLLFPNQQSLPGLEPVRISPLAIGVMTAALSGVLLTAVFVGTRAQRRKVTVGSETLVGLSGVALTEVNPEGIVRVGNEEWSATSVGDEIHAGDEIDVVAVKGVHLVIMRRL